MEGQVFVPLFLLLVEQRERAKRFALSSSYPQPTEKKQLLQRDLRKPKTEGLAPFMALLRVEQHRKVTMGAETPEGAKEGSPGQARQRAARG